MANDLRVDLKLGTEEYDRNVRKSKKQIKEYEDSVNASANQIAKGVGLVAAAWLGAESAVQIFNKTINSTQATGDAFQKMVDQMTASSNLFFASMAQADMSVFVNGLKNAISEAGKLSVILDNLATNKMFSTPAIAKLDREIAAQTQIVKDKSKSKAERTAAAARVEQLQQQKKSVKELTLSQSLSAGYQSFKSGMADVGYNSSALLTSSAIDQLMENLRTGKAGDIGAKYKMLYDSQTERVKLAKGGYANIKNTARVAEYEAFMNTSEGRWSEANYYANQAPDDQSSKLGQAVENLTYAYNAQTQLITEETSNIRARNMIGGSGGNSSGSVKSGKTTDNYTPLFDAQLYINPTTEFDRLQKEIALHESLQVPIELVPEEELGDSFAFNNGKNPLENIVPKTTLEDYGNLAIAIAGVTTNLTNGGNAWINYGANIISAVASALPALNTLLTANTAVAGSGAAASVASIPFIGWAMAGVALAGVVASIASLPKFATGGIVAGGSYSGDKIPALLNSGEMVLNDRQQSNLFNQLDRSNSGNNQSGEVVFKIKGDYLEGILQKNSRKKSRI